MVTIQPDWYVMGMLPLRVLEAVGLWKDPLQLKELHVWKGEYLGSK